MFTDVCHTLWSYSPLPVTSSSPPFPRWGRNLISLTQACAANCERILAHANTPHTSEPFRRQQAQTHVEPRKKKWTGRLEILVQVPKPPLLHTLGRGSMPITKLTALCCVYEQWPIFQGMVVSAFNPTSLEVEAGESLWAPRQPSL